MTFLYQILTLLQLLLCVIFGNAKITSKLYKPTISDNKFQLSGNESAATEIECLAKSNQMCPKL